MNHLCPYKFFLTWIVLLIMYIGVYAQNAKPFVVPELKVWKGEKGFFIPGDATRIVYDESDLQIVAEQFAVDYQLLLGNRLKVMKGKPHVGDFFFTRKKDRELGEEGYDIRISEYVRVSAPETEGVYWATRTLLQISEQSANHQLPKGKIRDWPDYHARGLLMDCARKFIPMSYLKDLVKIMAYYKMNVLHVHLNDNGFKPYFDNDWGKTYAAFRLECETFQGLTARDGFYTKREFIDFQKEAARQFVEIIPEIDVPAHSLAFSHYKTELGSQVYGMDHLDLFNEESYSFVDALFKEYLEGDEPVFCGPRVHIGTDEYSNKNKDVVEKFRAFTDHYIKYIESFGKQAVVWGALTHAAGETPVKSENVIMYAWYNGYAEPLEMVKQGYKLISIPDGWVYIVPAAGYYNDYLNTEYLYKNWTPACVGKVTFKEKDPAILGGMFAVWNDHVGNGVSVKDIHHRVFPALQTLSGKIWNTAVTVPYEEFNIKCGQLHEAPGVNQMAKIGDKPCIVYEIPELLPGMELPFPEIGYDYAVTFDMETRLEENGTELFRSPHAVFYLADPVKGMFGFARDGYLNTFRFRPYPDEKIKVMVTGNSRSTSLFVNGKLVEKLDIQKRFFDGGKAAMNYLRTLVFPLEKAGMFKSRITNLKVYNYEMKI